MLSDNQIEDLLVSRRELAALCSQNGWIDSASISYEVIEQADQYFILNVSFTEIIMQGAGCIAGRIACYGQVKIECVSDLDEVILTIIR